ncbi:MAG: hypothetical protein Q8T08_04620, partial [Ignavibacteria bacterium]|nr:hypothetical protein [Ignavibacteria bacterium]
SIQPKKGAKQSKPRKRRRASTNNQTIVSPNHSIVQLIGRVFLIKEIFSVSKNLADPLRKI